MQIHTRNNSKIFHKFVAKKYVTPLMRNREEINAQEALYIIIVRKGTRIFEEDDINSKGFFTMIPPVEIVSLSTRYF